MVLVFTVALVSAVTLSAPGAPASRAGRPHIVLIVADDLDYRMFSRLPYFRRAFTERGTSFTHAYAADSLCCPSRASMLRGQYVHNHRVLSNTAPEGGYSAFVNTGDEESTLGTWMDDSGYRTGMFGKYLNGYPPRDDPDVVPPGWDQWHVAEHGAIHQYGYTMVENGQQVYYGYGRRDYSTDVVSRKVSEFVRGHEQPFPFFMYVAPFAPHMPATAAPRYRDALPDVRAPRTASFDQRRVSASPEWVRELPPLSRKRVRSIDAMYRKRRVSMLAVRDLVRDTLRVLRRTGELDNTYLIFTSDNGYHLGQHRARAGKRSPYEEDIHIPLVVRGPGVPEGRKVGAMVSNVDLAPTISDLGGASYPDFVDGRSLVPFLRGKRPATWRDTVLSERHSLFEPLPETGHHPSAPQLRRHTVIHPPPFYALRTRRYTYVEYISGEIELYDNRRDPAQLRNLARVADPGLLQSLSASLHRMSTCSGASCRVLDGLHLEGQGGASADPHRARGGGPSGNSR